MKRVTLGEIATVSSGGTPDRSRLEYWGGTTPWVKTGEIQFNTITDTEEKITDVALRESSARAFPAGTLLMAMYGQGKTRGQVALLGIGAAINQACAAITPQEPEDASYLFQYLAFHYANIRRLSNSGSQENLNAELIRSIPIQYPPLPVRRKIADVLTAWDEALEKLDALIAAKERRNQGLMQQLLTGRIRFPALAKSSWKKMRMGELLTRVFRPIEWTADMRLSLVSLRRRCGGLFRRPDVLGAGYKTHDLHELKSNDFLISKRQVVHGAWAVVPPDFEGSLVSKEYAILVSSAPDKLHMPFFAWLAQTPRMIRHARIASTGVHIEKLIFDPEVFLRESIRIPATVPEQKHIAAILDATQTELNLLRAKRISLDQQKRGLMQKLLTGAIRVRTENHD
jgi:type I restriction enzyme S subunit